MSQIDAQTIIIAVDSLGDEKWRWESGISLEEGGAGAIQKTDTGNWIYLSGRIKINLNQNSWAVQPKVIQRDSNFNLIWDKSFGIPSSFENRFTDLVKVSANDWIAIGFMSNPITPKTLSGWVNKFSNDSDSIWSRVDTILYYNDAYTEHYLSSGVVLPSGSILCSGVVNDFSSSNRSWGWLIKIDNNGCVDTTNCIVSAIKDINSNSLDNAYIYPNPCSNRINIDPGNISEDLYGEVLIYSSIGKSLYHEKIDLSTSQYDLSIDTDFLKNGIYLLCIRTKKSVKFFNLVKMN